MCGGSVAQCGAGLVARSRAIGWVSFVVFNHGVRPCSLVDERWRRCK